MFSLTDVDFDDKVFGSFTHFVMFYGKWNRTLSARADAVYNTPEMVLSWGKFNTKNFNLVLSFQRVETKPHYLQICRLIGPCFTDSSHEQFSLAVSLLLINQ